jgi:hypothetical protein
VKESKKKTEQAGKKRKNQKYDFTEISSNSLILAKIPS